MVISQLQELLPFFHNITEYNQMSTWSKVAYGKSYHVKKRKEKETEVRRLIWN